MEKENILSKRIRKSFLVTEILKMNSHRTEKEVNGRSAFLIKKEKKREMSNIWYIRILRHLRESQ